MIWGTTFLLVQMAKAVSGPYFFVGLRFGKAAMVILPFTWRALKGLTNTEMRAGFLVWLSLPTDYVLPTLELHTIPITKLVLTTPLYVQLAPLLQWLVYHRPQAL